MTFPPGWSANRSSALVIESRVFTALWRFALKPLLVIAPFWALGWLAGLEWRGTIPTSAVAFVARQPPDQLAARARRRGDRRGQRGPALEALLARPHPGAFPLDHPDLSSASWRRSSG